MNTRAKTPPSGKGSIPGTPDLTRGDGPLAKSDDLLLQHAERGFQTPGSPMAMPAKGGNASLSGEDLKDAIAYMRGSFGPPVPAFRVK